MNHTKWTDKLLKSFNPCADGYDWYIANCRDKTEDTVEIINMLIAAEKLDWAAWTMARALSDKNKIRYAIYAAEQILGIFEEKYPNDKRPRLAIDAAKEYLKNPCELTKDAVKEAANAAYAGANAAAYSDYAAHAAARKKILAYGISLLSGSEA